MQSNEFRAFTGSIHTKESALALAQKHFDADNFVKGTYWDDAVDKGCSVGCMTVDYCKGEKTENWHAACEPLFGIPRTVAFLQDTIFEGLPLDQAKHWTLRIMNAVPTGGDLSQVTDRFMHWLMTDPEGPRKHARPDGLAAIDQVAALYERRLKGDTISSDEWDAAARAARAAYAADAARAARAAYAADAAYAAARAAYAAARAAYAAARAADAADAAADAAAYAAAYERMADKLIELLAAAPCTPLAAAA